MAYIACVETQELGVIYLCDEGMKSTATKAFADRWSSRRLAADAARFYAKECNRAARELGWPEDAVPLVISD